MQPLLPETAEGGDARARPDEDARVGGVLGELEAAGTEGDRRKEAPSSDTLGRMHTQDRGWGAGDVARGGSVAGWRRQRAQS